MSNNFLYPAYDLELIQESIQNRVIFAWVTTVEPNQFLEDYLSWIYLIPGKVPQTSR